MDHTRASYRFAPIEDEGRHMRTHKLLVATAAGIFTLGAALPASAGPGDTTATLSWTPGWLST